MAMIGKQVPQGPDTNAPARRVVVKLRRAPQNAAVEAPGRDTVLQSLARSLPGASVRPYFEDVRAPSIADAARCGAERGIRVPLVRGDRRAAGD